MFRKLSSSPMPKTKQESRTLESVDLSQHETKASFNSLPDKLIKDLLPFTFLGSQEAADVLPQVSKKTDELLKDKSAYHQLEVHRKTKEVFQQLTWGEQDQVKAILEKAKKSNSDFLLDLLTTPFTITDHANRQFDKITLFQLAVWYLDRHMWEMLLEYLPPEKAAIQLQEHESGKASYVKEHGRHYDFEGPKGLVSALGNYIQLVDKPAGEINMYQADQQWKRGVGGAQGQAPLHVIHEYCRKDIAFYPLTGTRFKEKTLPRKVDFYNWMEGRHFGPITFGTSFALYRGAGTPAARGRGYDPLPRWPSSEQDFAAVRRLCQVRKEEYGLLKKDLVPELDSSQEKPLSLSPKPGR